MTHWITAPLASVRVRLTLWYVTLLAVVLVGFSVLIYTAVSWNLIRGVDENLSERARQLSRQIDVRNGRLNVVQLIPTDSGAARLAQRAVFYRVWNASGGFVEVTNLSDPIEIDPAVLARSLEEGEVFTTQELEGDEAVRLLSVPIIESPGRAYGILQVGQSLAGVYASQQVLGFLLLGAVPLTLVIASVGGLFLANRALGPIDRLTRRARTITAQDLSQRMDVKHGNDEVGRLATTLDEMIGRLEAAFLSQRRFAADASHELRTPLAVVRSSVDLALDRERTTDEYRETLLSVRQEVARMSRIVNDLLVLARADAGRQPLELEEFAADKLLLDIVESAHPLAAEYDMMIRRGEVAEVDIRADESRLTQLVLNLVDNAIKYTPAGGSIVLSSKVVGTEILFEVSDTGIGVAEEDRERIFERFYRVDKARSREKGSSGLGLSIVRWIAEAHGGGVRVVPRDGPGTTFEARIPGVLHREGRLASLVRGGRRKPRKETPQEAPPAGPPTFR